MIVAYNIDNELIEIRTTSTPLAARLIYYKFFLWKSLINIQFLVVFLIQNYLILLKSPPRPYSTSYLILRYFVAFHFLEMVFWRPFLRRSPLKRGSCDFISSFKS